MPYPIENKFVIAISASALFDTKEDERVFKDNGIEAYKQYQSEHEHDIYKQGFAFDFIEKFLHLNDVLEDNPVEVVLFTRNSPDLGKRIMESIKHYNLNICRTHFSSGEYNYKYLPAFNACLFLSCNEEHTRAAMKAGFAAGTVIPQTPTDEYVKDPSEELRFAFDFDGVIADDSSEQRYNAHGKQLSLYFSDEEMDAQKPLNWGPMKDLLLQISKIQQLEENKCNQDPSYQKKVKLSLITARNAPADERVITTLNEMMIKMDMAFFMGGIDKSRVINIMKPHIYFDDDINNLHNLKDVVAVHIPFGVVNEPDSVSAKQE